MRKKHTPTFLHFSLIATALVLSNQAWAGEVLGFNRFRAQARSECGRVYAQIQTATVHRAEFRKDLKPSLARETIQEEQLPMSAVQKLPIRIYKLDLSEDFDFSARQGISKTSADFIERLDTTDDLQWSIRAREDAVAGIDIFDSTGKKRKTIRIEDTSLIWKIRFVPKTHVLAALLPEKNVIRFYSADSGEIIKDLAAPKTQFRLNGLFQPRTPTIPESFSFSENGQKILVVWNVDGVRNQVTVHDVQDLITPDWLNRKTISAGNVLPGLEKLKMAPPPREETVLQKVNGRMQEVGTGKFFRIDNRDQESFSQFRVLNDGRVLAISSKMRLGVELAPQGGTLREFALPDLAGFLPIEAISADGGLIVTAEKSISRNGPDAWLEAVERPAEVNVISPQGELLSKINYEPFVHDVLGIQSYQAISVRSLAVAKENLQLLSQAPVYNVKFLLEIKSGGLVSHWMTVWRVSTTKASSPVLVWSHETTHGDVPVMKGE